MARRARAIGSAPRLGWAAAGTVALLTLGTLGAVALSASEAPRLAPADWAAIRFTVLQAVLSALFSVGLAIPVARALARRGFPGRGLLITLLGAPFILPVIVAILGLLAVFGRGGLLNAALSPAGVGPVSIYGLHGVVLAHVFFNLPLATRLLLQGWLDIPGERFRLAASLGMSPREIRRFLEFPMLRSTVPGALMIVFLICLTSFAVALTLGGGPRATTVELAIYQAFRFEFDLGRAALLAGVQFALTGLAALSAWRFATHSVAGAGLDRIVERWDARTTMARAADTAWITAASLFLLLPMAMIVMRGLPGLAEMPPEVGRAALRSVLVALASVVVTLALALPLATGAVALRARVAGGIMESAGYLSIAASPLVLGTGLFLVLFPIMDPSKLALPVTAVVNALMSLPFVIRILIPAIATAEDAHGRLADSLGMHGAARLRWLIWPRTRHAIAFGAGLAAALSMGDLGVIALFADPETATLPLQVFRLMGAYRTDAAAGAALLLLALSIGLFWAFDRGGRANAPL